MKTLKIIDAVILIGLLVFYTGFAILHSWHYPEAFFTGYFIVGGYQLTSCIIQLPCVSGRKASRSRRIYQRLLIGLVIAGIVTIPVFIIFLYALLVVSPFLAVFYTVFSVNETVQQLNDETAGKPANE